MVRAIPKAALWGLCIKYMTILGLNHRFAVVSGVLENECAALLSDFFARLREKK